MEIDKIRTLNDFDTTSPYVSGLFDHFRFGQQGLFLAQFRIFAKTKIARFQ